MDRTLSFLLNQTKSKYINKEMAKKLIEIPVNYARLMPLWTANDHRLFRNFMNEKQDNLEAFKMLLSHHSIDYSGLE